MKISSNLENKSKNQMDKRM